MSPISRQYLSVNFCKSIKKDVVEDVVEDKLTPGFESSTLNVQDS